MTPLQQALSVLLADGRLHADQSHGAFAAIMDGQASPAELAALLALLARRLVGPEELLGAAHALRARMSTLLPGTPRERLVDTCGTGGAPKTFNVSTTAAIVAAACGAKVAKHGNRSRTGRGSAELVEALGVDLHASPERQVACLDELGICFCLASRHHEAMRHVAQVRAQLGFSTVFNLLGPLSNPAGAQRHVLGVYDVRFMRVMAETLRALGVRKALVVHSRDGLDELSISAPTELLLVTPDGIGERVVCPEDLGLRRAPRELVVARDLAAAVTITRDVVAGRERGPCRDMTLLGAAAALFVSELVPDLREGVRSAAHAIDDGRAQTLLERWIARSSAPPASAARS